ncbi:MAG: hypothetical protein DMF63_07630 [Acidobacteria bacterium]|nr:MAG: hypothetical protein DMF63_07630 [Acidobacteriota bacterium]
MRLRYFLFLLALLAISTPAQAPAKILKQAEKAMGGAKSLASVASFVKTGKISQPGRSGEGSFIVKTARPNLFYFSNDLYAESEVGYNGRSGWIRDSLNGLRTLTGVSSVNLQAKAAFRNALWLNYKKDKSKITSDGVVKINGASAHSLRLTTSKGVTIKLYFDTSTGLLIRDEIPNAAFVETTDYSDYRDVSGVKVAFAQRILIDNEIFDVRFIDVKTNSNLDDAEFDFPKRSGEPMPDIPALLKDLQANEDKVEELLDTYSYMQRSTSRVIDKNGVLQDKESLTYQLSFYKGYRIRRLIEKNGKPLSDDEQKDEDKEAGKRVEEIEKQIAKRESSGIPRDDESRRVSIAEVLRASKLSNPRRERFRGRDVIVFDFEPNPQFDYKNAKSMLKFFGKTAGAMWIDEKDKQVARLEATLSDSFNVGGGVVAKLKKGASFTLEQDRINDEIWLPSAADINLSVRVLLVKGIDLNQSIRSYDYRKFSTEVKDAKVDPVNQP